MTIEGKVAIVTGGASGLGRATAEALIANGAKGGLNSMALPIARGLARNGTRIAGIAPGLFETSIYKKQETIDALMKDCVFPVRFGKPHEFASLLLEIVRNSMINGTTIRLDGAVRF